MHSIGYKQLLRVVQSEDDDTSHVNGLPVHTAEHVIPLFGDPSVANHVYAEGQPISTKFKSQTQYKVPMFVYIKDLLFPQLWSLQFKMLSKKGHAGKGLFQEVTSYRQDSGSPVHSEAVTRIPQIQLQQGLVTVPAPRWHILLQKEAVCSFQVVSSPTSRHLNGSSGFFFFITTEPRGWYQNVRSKFVHRFLWSRLLRLAINSDEPLSYPFPSLSGP